MKRQEENKKDSIVEESKTPYMRTFSSQEEAERFNMIENLEKTDMEKFRLFCRMMRIGKMLSTAKIVK
ncbi:MAG: hypothetical protein IPN82_16555 [Chitinophagaceae bacterium]|nr:hypothetical protein [Chitinophagaceae bacterium]MBP6477553.1 hypothetical protein [Chitinophagaceae bacterium]MBP7109345.1 hypothetical protein [Chitinophagaceae bacterium]MBP7316537.1 hypothetical protein [Chitinophagaceae bacterium]HQX97175.1 hypothetical protein [Chitinophagaceae bacterium]